METEVAEAVKSDRESADKGQEFFLPNKVTLHISLPPKQEGTSPREPEETADAVLCSKMSKDSAN